MNLFAQHAYGKSDKIERALTDMSIDGAILSPRGEKPATLDSTIASLKSNFPRCTLLIDPQFHYSAFSPVKLGNLGDYSYFNASLTRANFLSASSINDYVDKVLKYQAERDLDYIVSPTVFFNSFNDTWSQVALQLAQASIERHKLLDTSAPLLISLVFAETALGENAVLDEFLNLVTTLDAHGFYLTVRRNSTSYRPQMDPNYLESLMYLVYSLADRNDFCVLLGYTDIIGIIFQCFDILGTGSGWFSTSRQFTSLSYEPQSGGSQPRPRYMSAQMLNSITVFPELDALCSNGFTTEVLCNTNYDKQIVASRDQWNNSVSALHHWAVLKQLSDSIRLKGNTSSRLSYLLEIIDQAQLLYDRQKRSGIVFETTSGDAHLDQWKRAIAAFRSRVKI